MTAFQIRKTIYRDKPGFLIVGPRARVFAETRAAAEHIRDKLKAGLSITTFDFHYKGTIDPEGSNA